MPPADRKHWPTGSLACLCGTTFRNREDALAHARAFIPAWRFIGYSNGQSIQYTPGHQMAFTRDALVPTHYRVMCSCGTKALGGLVGWLDVGLTSRKHAQAVIKEIINGT